MFFAEKVISFFSRMESIHIIALHFDSLHEDLPLSQSREVCFNSNSLDQYSNMEEFVIIQEKKGINLLFSKWIAMIRQPSK